MENIYSKKLEFNTNKPETSLKKIDFNIINDFDEIDDKIDNKVGNKTLCLRACYALYVKLNNNSNGHLIYRSSTDQIVVTKDYRTVPAPEALVDTTSKTDAYDKKSQVDNLDTIQSKVHDDQFNNNDDDGNNPFSNKDQYLHGILSAILPLQTSLTMPIHENILHHIQDDISKFVHIISSLLMYQRNKILRSSLLTSPQSKFL